MKFFSALFFALIVGAVGKRYQLRMNTLVVYLQDVDKILPVELLEGYDTAYTLTNSLPNLDRPDFHSIVVTRSAISAEIWSGLRNYAANYNIRIVCLDSDPTAAPGLSAVNSTANQLTFDQSPDALKLADVVCTSCTWPIASAGPRPATIINDRIAQPLLRFVGDTNAGPGAVAAAILKTPYNTEEMHFFYQAWASELNANGNELPVMQYEHTKVNLAIGNVWFQYATRGIYQGMRRIALQMHVDDWYSGTSIYKTQMRYRIDGQAVKFNAEWAKNFSQTLPAGSRVYMEPAFNGAGYSALGLGNSVDPMLRGDGLGAMTAQYSSAYNWLSHTWTHQNLDYLYAAECNGVAYSCLVDGPRATEEIAFNKDIAIGQAVLKSDYKSSLSKLNLYDTPANDIFSNANDLASHYSPSCLVTPEISGLWPGTVPPPPNRIPKPVPNNAITLNAIFAQGIRTVVGDNSRPELRSNVSKHHGIWMAPPDYTLPLTRFDNGTIDGMMIIPRHAVSIFFDAFDDASLMAEYRDSQACAWSPGVPCTNQSYTFEAAMLREAKATTIMWLSYRMDPFMFHQANLHPFQYQGRTVSLASHWIELAVSELQKYVDKIPIVSPRMEVTAQLYRERMYRDTCGINSYIDIGDDGLPASLSFSTEGYCRPVVTVAQSGSSSNLRTAQSQTNGQSYGRDQTYVVNMYPLKQKTIQWGDLGTNQMTAEPIEILPKPGANDTAATVRLVAIVVCSTLALVGALALAGAGLYFWQRKKLLARQKTAEPLF